MVCSGAGDAVDGGASHSDSAAREMASRRFLRWRDVADVAEEGKEGGESAEESEEEEDEKSELEDISGGNSWVIEEREGGVQCWEY